ncbi:MAG: GTP cyclohydrolase FolE2 [Candidatus Zixiibacteriota bacterium]
MNDVQNESPSHKIAIDRVGVRNLRYPIIVLDRSNEKQQTVASVSMFVDLPESYRGTHMSRFIEILNRHRGKMTSDQVAMVTKEMQDVFNASQAHFKVEFDYFIEKKAPVTGHDSLLSIDCFFEGNRGDDYHFILGVRVPVLTLCPCSKEISDRGAHNQRAYVDIQVEFEEFIWIEELVEVAEQSASAPIYPLIKRPDEKFITELAFDNPVFVEDLARNIAKVLDSDKRIYAYKIQVESHESIHTHNAFACISKFND